MATNISTATSSKDSQEEEDSDAKEISKGRDDISSLCPFKILWSFGINSKVPLINLTTENRTIIAYACSHIVIIYNYVSKTATTLQGHKNAVKTLSISKDGKWLLSADFEKDSVVVVWDTESGVPICTLFNPHGENGITAARISPNAKYIVTVGNEKHQKVCFWLWTYGRDESDDNVELTEISDRMKEITFNENSPEEFTLIVDYQLAFFRWEDDKLKHSSSTIFDNVRRYGIFNCSCYISKIHQVLAATANGYILTWNMVSKKGHSKVGSGEIKHIKIIRLQKCSITVILYYNEMIVTGNSEGRINFYDLQLKILHWYYNHGLDSIRSISFNLQSKLLGPASIVSAFELDVDKEDDLEDEEELKEYSENNTEDSICDEKIEYLQKIESKTLEYQEKVSSTLSENLEQMFGDNDENQESRHIPVDASFKDPPLHIDNFFVSTLSGVIALIKIPILKCQFILRSVAAPITSLDAHPRSNYIVTGNTQGLACLYNYEKRKLIVCRKTPPIPDFNLLLDKQAKANKIVYITCPQSYEKLTAITLLKYSPIGDMLACGLETGTLFMLHPITLKPLDEIPYKHSTESIIKLIFTECANYMAYSDNTFVVAVFKRHHDSSKGSHLWDFIGKYRSHCAIIRDILFEPVAGSNVLRLFSLGEDQNLIAYDLVNSGPYPDPGLVISKVHRIENIAIPLCLSWYPEEGIERFLMISNSEVLSKSEFGSNKYLIFVTDKEIGLQMLPFDGNPYKILGIIGHPNKITNICVNHDGNILFTSGYNDQCVLMWKIKYRSVDVLAHLGGEGLAPYYCLIEGGRNGWLIKEMIDLFYYAQILHQGENTTATRIVSEKVATKQIPNLMRAIGYYPSNEEIEILMGEISYKNYAETGQLVEEITFEDFVKLYINHRPPFGISLHELQEAFQVFKNPSRDLFLDEANPVLTRDQFVNILFGKGSAELPEENNKVFGEPLTHQEAYMYLKFLIGSDDNLDEIYYQNTSKRSMLADFTFLPERISYKDFTADILGIELPEETRADDE